MNERIIEIAQHQLKKQNSLWANFVIYVVMHVLGNNDHIPYPHSYEETKAIIESKQL
jgi:hypothetical protein